jgi:hypothetical protein
MLDNMKNSRLGGVCVGSGRGRMRHALAKQILRFQVVQWPRELGFLSIGFPNNRQCG